MARILIVHGWMHSIRRYSNVKKDLEKMGHEVVVLRQEGFGGVTESEEPIGYFDLAIGHSMGGYYLIKNQERFKDTALFLVAPVYEPIKVPKILVPMLRFYGKIEDSVQSKSPEFIKSAVNSVLVWMASMTVYRKECVDSLLIEDVHIADKEIAADTIGLLINLPKVKAQPHAKSIIIHGDKDALVNPKGVFNLWRDLGSEIVNLPGIGHTPFMEDYPNVMRILLKFMQKHEVGGSRHVRAD